jgi:hypothetical protein
MWTEQEVKNAINDAYMILMDEARLQETGYGRKRTYSNSVADQLYYDLPDDFMKVVDVEIDVDGNALSASGSNPIFLKPISATTGFEGYEKGIYTNTEFYTIHSNDYIAIFAPPSSGGSSAIRLTYEAHSSTLSNDTDEPTFRDPYHYLICYEAAAVLKGSVDLTLTPEHEGRRQRLYARFMETTSENVQDDEGQIYVAGRITQRPATVTGFINRGVRYPDRSRWPQ